jgi:hypothetical protein
VVAIIWYLAGSSVRIESGWEELVERVRSKSVGLKYGGADWEGLTVS